MEYKKTVQKILLFSAVTLMVLSPGKVFTESVYASEQKNTDNAEDTKETDNDLVYNFKDPKKEGTVTFVKKWKDNKTNDERPVPDIEISTKKPEVNIKGYTVTFHSNGLKFTDGTSENKIVLNSSKEVVEGQYKLPVTSSYIYWYTDSECRNKVSVSKDGIPDMELTGDIDLYAKAVTFVLKQGSDLNKLIPDDVTSVIFTDEEMSKDMTLIDVDMDGDSGVVAWIQDGVMKISTQIEGVPVQFNNLANSMFAGKANISNIEFNNVETSKLTSIAYMFNGCTALTKLDLSMFDTSNVTTATGAFLNCSGLTLLDVSNFNASKFIYTTAMFKNCSSLLSVDVSGWDTGNMNNMSDMFNGCKSLTELDVSGWNTSKVTGMGYAFYNCNSLTTLDVSHFDTSKVNSFVGAFAGCNKVTELDVSGFNTENATNMSNMFGQCWELTSLDVSNFNTSKVTTMANMFHSCVNVKELDVSNFDTSNVTNMSYMFGYCKAVTKINVSNFNTLKVNNMELMFYDCHNLTSLDLSSFDTPKLINMCNMFNLDYTLTYLDLSNFDTSNVTNMNWAFYNLNKLKTFKIGEKFAFVGNSHGPFGTWVNIAGEEFDGPSLPNNVADTYTRK